MAHITGGGFPGNLNRSLPFTLDAVIDVESWQVPPLFAFLAETGKLSERELYRSFNMGIGMVLFVEECQTDKIIESLRASGETVYVIGRVERGNQAVKLIHGI
jgi:phosphoribosylformylglycinamidine cyclo-ligase